MRVYVLMECYDSPLGVFTDERRAVDVTDRHGSGTCVYLQEWETDPVPTPPDADAGVYGVLLREYDVDGGWRDVAAQPDGSAR